MTLHLPIQAVAPGFGVRVIVEEEVVRVMASDSGGRGSARDAVVVPIAWRSVEGRRNPRLVVPGFEVSDARLLTWSELERAGARFLVKDGDTADSDPPAESPYFYRLARAQWPALPDLDAARPGALLILLLYHQSAGIGATVPLAPISARLKLLANDKPASRADNEETYENQAAGAIAAAIARPAHELRGGLIEGRLRSAEGPAESMTFAVASCHYPSDILDRMPEEDRDARGPADASLLALRELMDKDRSPTLLLLAGDQVYTDATGGLFDPKVANDRFRIPYERRGASRGAQAVLQRLDLEVRTMMDDHEIQDNWEPPDPTDPRDLGKRHYFKFQRTRADSDRARDLGPIAFAFEHRGFHFFMGDTRTEREGRTALNFPEARIMSDEQFDDLCLWLVETSGRPRFVLTSTALFPRRLAVSRDPASALQSDAWDGYPFSQHCLLSTLCEEQHEGVVFLSGDEHRSSFSRIDVERIDNGKKCRLHSIHSSALYAPYSFANGAEANFDTDDTFLFPDPQKGPYRCSARTGFAQPGDGFAIVTVDHQEARWRGTVEFHDAAGPKRRGRIAFPLM